MLHVQMLCFIHVPCPNVRFTEQKYIQILTGVKTLKALEN